ncbi:ABC transporter permease [Lachnospiraceae bacterium 62-35]
MKINPICRRETRAAARSIWLPAMITAFNSILALVALLSMYLNVAQIKLTAEIQYRRFLELYVFTASIEFFILVLLMPALTAGAVSGERERQTLDIMMTTRVSRWDVVSGKLSSSFMVMFLVVISSLPVMALVFVYGGIQWLDLGSLFLCYMVSALLAGSVGIFCSALFKRSTVATVIAYIMTAGIMLGTYAANMLASSFTGLRLSAGGMMIRNAAEQNGSGSLLYLLLINPSSTFIMILGGQMNASQNHIESWFGARPSNMLTEHWVPVSIAVQLAAAVLLITAAVKMMDRERAGGKYA